MRVLEADPSISYKMGKSRKHRIRKAREDNTADASSDEAQMTGCPHINKAVNLTLVRKTISRPSVSLGECSTCCKEGTKSTTRDLFGNVNEGLTPAPESEDPEVEPTVCICLQCGHQGCDRNSLNKHALKHYKTPHSSVHSIIVNLTHWSTWCYICDEEVPVNTRIQNCIDILQKQLGLGQSEPLSPTVKQVDSPLTDSASSPINNSSLKPSPSVSCAKVKGLSNLGNTCFFNAVMQSISQTRGLENLLVDRTKQDKVFTIVGPEVGPDSDASGSSDSEREEDGADSKLKLLPSIQTVYSDPGPITLTLLGFLQEMKGGTAKNGTINPTALFTQVCKKAPRFKGFQQQDSHELLRYLVDCIRTEEIRRGQGSILKFFKLTENINPKKVDDETKTKIKEYGKQVKHTFLDFVFGGQLVSTVKCEECKNVSQIYEAFLDISVPVTEEKPQRPNLSLLGRKKDTGGGVAAAAAAAAAASATADAQDDTTGAAADLSAMGLDAYGDKSSKHMDRKTKKVAKKDAKRKAKLQKSKSSERNELGGHLDNDDKGSPDGENGSDDSNKMADGNDSGDGVVKTINNDDKGANGRKEHDNGTKETEGSRERGSPPREVASPGSRNASTPEGSKDSKDSLYDNQDKNSSRDDPSDADIEDNLEGDLAQQHGLSSSQSSASTTTTTSAITTSTTATTPMTTTDSIDDFPAKEMADGGQQQQSPDTDSQQQQELDTSESLGGGLDRVLPEDGVRSLIAGVNKLVISAVGEPNGNVGPGEYHNSGGHSHASKPLTNGDAATTTDNSVVGPKDKETPVSGVDSIKGKMTDYGGLATGDASSAISHGCKNIPEEKEELVGVGNGDVFKKRLEQLKEAKQHAMNSLAPRYHPAPKECSILTCLNQFTAAELLTGSNKVSCKECSGKKTKHTLTLKSDKKGKDKVYSNASKQYLIFRPPAVLTLHLKRFEQTGLMSRKVNRHVDFPLVLDLAPYCSALASGVKEGQTKVLYSLYGVVEHSGRLSGGHYTAYIKVRPGIGSYTQFLHTNPPGQADVLNIFYERVLKTKLKEDTPPSSPVDPYGDRFEGQSHHGAVDQDLQARAECLAPPGRWFHISDSRVNEVSEAVVLKAQAYLLFYERIF